MIDEKKQTVDQVADSRICEACLAFMLILNAVTAVIVAFRLVFFGKAYENLVLVISFLSFAVAVSGVLSAVAVRLKK